MKKRLIILTIPLLFFGCKEDIRIFNISTKIDTAKVKHTEKPNIKSDIVINEIDEEYIQKATVNLKDSTIAIQANMKLDHRIFGYEKPNVNSKKMILYSIFTDDVENNPYRCPLGAYYDTAKFRDMTLKFQENTGDFAKVKIITDATDHIVYFEKKWLKFK